MRRKSIPSYCIFLVTTGPQSIRNWSIQIDRANKESHMTIQNSALCLENPGARLTDGAVHQAFDANNHGGSDHSPSHVHGASRYGSWDIHRHRPQVTQLFALGRNTAGDSPLRLQHDLHRARRMLLRLDFSDAFDLIACIESALALLPAGLAVRVRDETKRLRAIGAALQDDSLGALHVASMILKSKEIGRQTEMAALAVCRFAYWRLGEMEGFYSLP